MPAVISNDSQPKPAGRGCVFYGCLTTAALAIVLLLTGYLTVRYIVNTGIENYTDSTPQEFEKIVISTAEREALLDRVAEFNEARGKTNQPVELTLTSAEINALIAEDKSENKIGDSLRVKIEEDGLNARVTIPLEQFSKFPFLSRLKGRHFNGGLRIAVTLEDGNAKISIVSAEVNGDTLPEEILEAIEKEISSQKTLNNPEIRKQLDRLDWIKIEDGKIRIATGGNEPPVD